MGFSMLMFVQENIVFLIGPLIGYIRDATKSYFICFNTLTFIMSLSAISWLCTALWLRLHPRKVKFNDNEGEL